VWRLVRGVAGLYVSRSLDMASEQRIEEAVAMMFYTDMIAREFIFFCGQSRVDVRLHRILQRLVIGVGHG
jgi:hypothetical protein